MTGSTKTKTIEHLSRCQRTSGVTRGRGWHAKGHRAGQRDQEPLIVSDFAKGEVSSAISRAVRTGKIEAEAGRDRLDAFDEWAAAATQPISTESGDIRLAAQLVRHFALNLKLPDAVHLAAVQIRDMRLATFDERLAVAAEQLRVELVKR